MPTLQQGSSGPDVRALQQRLSDLGFDPNGIDGIFGPGTDQAVRDFQAANGLDVDGKVGPKTRAALQLDSQTDGNGDPNGGTGTGAKVLWVVNYNSLNEFLQRARSARVTAVAIRTDNNI